MKEVDHLFHHGLAEPSNSSQASPSLLVPKPDSHPLPLIEELVDSIGQAKFLTKIDMQKGYYQIGLIDNAINISALIVPAIIGGRSACTEETLYSLVFVYSIYPFVQLHLSFPLL